MAQGEKRATLVAAPGKFFILLSKNNNPVAILLLLTCEQQFSPLQQNELTLKTEYVGVTDAELHLQVKNRPENTTFRLFLENLTIYI